MKTAVSIPDDVFEAADRLARRRRVSRSALYADALRLLLDSDDGGREVTARLDEVHGDHDNRLDPGLAVAQGEALREDW